MCPSCQPLFCLGADTGVGRILGDDPVETTAILRTGQHSIADRALVVPTFCAALSAQDP